MFGQKKTKTTTSNVSNTKNIDQTISWCLVLKYNYGKKHNNIYIWRVPNSLKDSNVSPKQKTMEEQRLGAHSSARNTLEG